MPRLDLMYTWSMAMAGRVGQPRNGWNWGRVMRGLPLHTLDEKVCRRVTFWREQMEHDRLDEFWMPVQMRGLNYPEIELRVYGG